MSTEARAGRPLRIARLLPPLIGILLFAGAAIVVARAFRHLHLHDVAAAMRAIPSHALRLAALLTVAAYLVLTFYDLLATRYAGRVLPWRRTAFASFCAYVLSHNLGFSAVSGAAVRYRLYAAWGLAPAEIARIIAFCSMTFMLGGIAIGGAVAIIEPRAVPFFGTHLPAVAVIAFGLGLWALVLGYVTLARRFPVVRIAGHDIALPGFRTAARQVLLASVDVGMTASIAYVLLPAAPGLSYPRFLTVYLVSYSAGLAANVPGGLGVFETAMMLGLSAWLPAPAILGAVLVFRLYYYVVPLFLAGIMFALHELYLRGVSVIGLVRPIPTRPSGVVRASEADFSVSVATGLAALVGASLLAIGAVAPRNAAPVLPFDLALLASHAGAYGLSLIGAALMVLAVGLAQRVTLAWGASILLLLLASVLVVTGQLPLLLACASVLAALLMIPYRHAYYRHARLLSAPLEPGTAVPLAALAASVLAFTLLAPEFRYLEQSSWWQVILSSAMPGRLRLSVLLLVVVFVFASWRLIRPGRVGWLAWSEACRARFLESGADAPERAEGIVLGETGRACIAFRRVGPVLLGLGDPAGHARDRISAIWRLRDLAVQEGRQAAVWRAGPELLDAWGDLGLTAWAIGADGRAENVDAPAGKMPSPGRRYLCCPDAHGPDEILAALQEKP